MHSAKQRYSPRVLDLKDKAYPGICLGESIETQQHLRPIPPCYGVLRQLIVDLEVNVSPARPRINFDGHLRKRKTRIPGHPGGCHQDGFPHTDLDLCCVEASKSGRS